MTRFAALVVLAWLLAVAARATDLVYPMQQSRTLSADVWHPAGPSSVEHAGPPAGLWYDVLTYQQELNDGIGVAILSAAQYSEITTSGIQVYGFADLYCSTGDYWPGLRVAGSDNRCWMRFAVPERVAFELSGDLSAETHSQVWVDESGTPVWQCVGRASLALRRVAGLDPYAAAAEASVLNDDPNCCNPYCEPFCPPPCYDFGCSGPEIAVIDGWPQALAGELLPGVYEIEVLANTSFEILQDAWLPWGPPFRAEATMVITVDFSAPAPQEPCVGDLDGDGDVDLLDFARFQACMGGAA